MLTNSFNDWPNREELHYQFKSCNFYNIWLGQHILSLKNLLISLYFNYNYDFIFPSITQNTPIDC